MFPLSAPLNTQNERVYSEKDKEWDVELDFLLRARSRNTARSHLEFLRDIVLDMIEKENWPRYCCNLKPLAYAVWRYMEQVVYKDVNRYETIDELTKTIKSAWNGILHLFNVQSINGV